MLKNLSLQRKFILASVSIFIITATVILVVVYINFKDNLDSDLYESSITHTSLMKEQIETWYTPKIQLINTLANVIGDRQVKDYRIYQNIFRTELNSNPEILDIFFVTAKRVDQGGQYINGSLKKFNTQNYNQYTRDWWKTAWKHNNYILTKPYTDLVTGNLVVTLAKKVKEKHGNALGVVALDISMDRLSQLVNEKKITEGSETYLLTRDGLFITNEKTESIMKENIFNDERFSSLKQSITDKKNHFTINTTTDLYYASTTLDSTGWLLFSYGPVDEIYTHLYAFIRKLIIIGIIGIITTGVFYYFIARMITVPLAEFSTFLTSLTNGNIENTIETDRTDEIGELLTPNAYSAEVTARPQAYGAEVPLRA